MWTSPILRESAVCAEIAPPLVDVGDGRQVACHNL